MLHIRPLLAAQTNITTPGKSPEYEEWQKYKAEKAKGHVLLPDTVRFICEANGYDAEKIGQHFLEILPKICPPEER